MFTQVHKLSFEHVTTIRAVNVIYSWLDVFMFIYQKKKKKTEKKLVVGRNKYCPAKINIYDSIMLSLFILTSILLSVWFYISHVQSSVKILKWHLIYWFLPECKILPGYQNKIEAELNKQ